MPPSSGQIFHLEIEQFKFLELSFLRLSMSNFDHILLGQLSIFAQDLSMGMSYMGKGQSYDIKRIA